MISVSVSYQIFRVFFKYFLIFMYEVFDHIYAHMNLVYCVTIVFNPIYFGVILYILYHWWNWNIHTHRCARARSALRQLLTLLMVFLNLAKLIRLPIQNGSLRYCLCYISKILHYLSREILIVLSWRRVTGNCWYVSPAWEVTSWHTFVIDRYVLYMWP
jgi:hypothetical protein